MSKKKSIYINIVFVFLFLFSFTSAQGQVRTGSAFLKMLPGARVQSMATAMTGGLDEVHSIYANPGAAGFIREWHWSAAYSKWIADVYNASFVFGKRIRNPLSNQTRFVLGILYQGMPEFDSSDHAVENATANDVVVSLSIGQSLSKLSKNIALGLNVKYLKSTLDSYNASTIIFDTGLLARTPKFSLGNSLLKFGIISAGAAITQMGSDLKFDRVGTPLPQTWRVGLSFYAGTHNGLQIQVSGDYHNVKDEDGEFGVGAELTWGNRFSINSGYNFNSNLMSKISFGGTIRLDDVITSEHTILPGRNNALKFELATIDEGEFFSRTYRGGIGHLPIGPEYFEFINPATDDTVKQANAVLKWESSRDPDLYDNIQYTLLMDRDITKLENLITAYDNDTDEFFSALSSSRSSLLKMQTVESDSFQVNNLVTGHYYWVVFAQDLDNHIRFAEKNNLRIAHFYVPCPDIEIKNIEFEHSPWITEDDYHGEIKITISNNGGLLAENFSIVLHDSSISPYRTLNAKKDKPGKKLILLETIEQLKPGEIQTFQTPWHTSHLGAHLFEAAADIEHKLVESDESNNQKDTIFYTIPKGTFSTDDTANVSVISLVTLDLPVISEVCFDKNSADVKFEYLHKIAIDPPVATIAYRLTKYRDLSISIQGFSDPSSDETNVELANRRAYAIRDSMIQLGVYENQIKILPGQVLPKLNKAVNPEDMKWVLEERRYAKISTDLANQPILFDLIRHKDTEQVICPLIFKSDVTCAVTNAEVSIYCSQNTVQDSVSIENLKDRLKIKDEHYWKIKKHELDSCLNKNIKYHLTVIDRLGREFQTYDQFTYLTESQIYRQHRIIIPLKFFETDPTHSFLFKRIFDEVNQKLSGPMKSLKFTAHACAIGFEEVNKTLSKNRAERFKQEFTNYCKFSHSGILDQILKNLDPAQGFGESKPLAIDRLNGERVLLGDNNTALGRKLNRRIEVELNSINND